jgi:hypothetical protein
MKRGVSTDSVSVKAKGRTGSVHLLHDEDRGPIIGGKFMLTLLHCFRNRKGLYLNISRKKVKQ